MAPNPSLLEAMNLKEAPGEASDSWLALEDALAEREVSLKERLWNGFVTVPLRGLPGMFLAIIFLPLTECGFFFFVYGQTG